MNPETTQPAPATDPTQTDQVVLLMTWLETNKKRLAMFAGIAVLVGGVYYVVNYFKAQRETEASQALSALRAGAVFAERTGGGTKASELQQIVQKYAGTRAAEEAAILAAGALFSEGQYEAAREAFAKFLQSHPRGDVGAAAAYGVAASLESLKKTDEAVAAYQEVTTRFTGSGQAAQAKLAMARLYEGKNQPDKAFEIYQELVRPTAPTMWTQEANQRREELVRKFPQLAVTNAPAAVTTNAPAPAVAKP